MRFKITIAAIAWLLFAVNVFAQTDHAVLEACHHKGSLEKRLACFKTIRDSAIKNGNDSLQAAALLMTGNIYLKITDKKTAHKYHEQALAIAKANKLFNILGKIFLRQHDYDDFRKIQNQISDNSILAEYYLIMAEEKLRPCDKAALGSVYLDSAQQYLPVEFELFNFKFCMAKSQFFRCMDNEQASKNFLDKCRAYAIAEPDMEITHHYYLMLYRHYEQFGKYKQALEADLKADSIRGLIDDTRVVVDLQQEESMQTIIEKEKLAEKQRIEKVFYRKILFIVLAGLLIFSLLLFITICLYRKVNKINKDNYQLFRIISHDIRSPLVSMRYTLDEADHGPSKESLSKELNSLIEFTDETLKWAAHRIKKPLPKKEKINLTSLIEENLLLFQPYLNNTGRQIEFNAERDIILQADAEMIRFAFRNLIFNALQNAPEKSDIVIKLTAKDDMHLTIKNQMTGLKPPSGHGIGMKIAKKFFEANNASMEVEKASNSFLVKVTFRKMLASSDSQ